MKLLDLYHVKRVFLTSLLLFLLCVSARGAILPVFHLGVLASPEETTVAVDPAASSANLGQYFTINFTITNVVDLYSWGVKLRWPYGFLEVRAENITEGLFLKQGGSTAFVKKNYTNYIDIACTLLGASSGVSGNGTLASVTFKVLDAGTATLDLYDVTLIGPGVQVIGDWKFKDPPDDGYFYTTFPVAQFTYTPHPSQYPWRPIVNETVTFNATESHDPDDPKPREIVSYTWDFDDGNITTVTNPTITHRYSEPGEYRIILNATYDDGETNVEELTVLIQLHDINVISVTVAPTAIYVGSAVTVNVTVLNAGNVPEHFNVTAYYNHDPIETKATKSLQVDESATITFSWDTTGVAEGSYQIRAEATDVEGEGSPQDNEFVDGTVTVKLAEQSFPTNIVVGAVVVVVVLALVLFLYTQRKRQHP